MSNISYVAEPLLAPQRLSPSTAMIAGVGTFAPQAYSQKELVTMLGFAEDQFANSISSGAKIDSRNFNASPIEWMATMNLDQLSDYHRQYAPEMAFAALRNACTDESDLANFDAVISASSTGYMLPGISEVLCEKYGVGRKNALRFDLVGQGCIAAFPAMQIAQSLISANRAKRVAVVCTEPQAALYNPTAASKECTVQKLIFGEGAAALRIEPSENSFGCLPALVDSEHELASDSLDAVSVKQGTVWESTLSRAVPDIAGSVLPGLIERLLIRNGLEITNIDHWAFHPGGRRVLEVSQSGLDLPDEQMTPSYEVMRLHGNMSSCSVLFALEKVIEMRSPKPGDLGLMIAYGPGMAVGAYLLRWCS